MVLWAGNFIVVKSAARRPAAGRVHVPAVPARVGDAVRSFSAGEKASIGMPRRDLVAIVRPRRPRLRALSDPVDDGPDDGPGRRLGADHCRDAGPRRPPRGRRPVRRADAGEARRRPRLVRRRRDRHRVRARA